MTMNVRRSTRL